MEKAKQNSRTREIIGLSLVLISVISIYFIYKKAAPAYPNPVVGNYSRIVGSSISEIAERASIIVIGTVVDTIYSDVNMFRNYENLSKPVNDIYAPGVFAEVHITEYLKGEGTKIIYITQATGVIIPGYMRNDASVEKAQKMLVDPLQVGKKYLFFLQGYGKGGYLDIPGEDLPTPLFIGVIEPWRFDISDSKLAVPESKTASFTVWPVSAIIEEIKNPTGKLNLLQTVPYPPPNPYP